MLTSETRGKPVCVIPARKNSRRLKHKNIQLLNGKPLVQHAIDVARDSGIFGEIIVTTDDPRIIEIAYSARVDNPHKEKTNIVVHKRARRMADSTTQIKHVCRFLMDSYHFGDVFAVLIPNNPFRTVEDIRSAYEMMWEDDANYVMSAIVYPTPPQWALKRKGRFVVPWCGEILQRQKLIPLYVHEGGLLFARTKIFLIEFDYDFYGSKCLPYFMKRSVDINTEEDLMLARFLLKEGK